MREIWIYLEVRRRGGSNHTALELQSTPAAPVYTDGPPRVLRRAEAGDHPNEPSGARSSPAIKASVDLPNRQRSHRTDSLIVTTEKANVYLW